LPYALRGGGRAELKDCKSDSQKSDSLNRRTKQEQRQTCFPYALRGGGRAELKVCKSVSLKTELKRVRGEALFGLGRGASNEDTLGVKCQSNRLDVEKENHENESQKTVKHNFFSFSFGK
jgi:hypothetical protein